MSIKFKSNTNTSTKHNKHSSATLARCLTDALDIPISFKHLQRVTRDLGFNGCELETVCSNLEKKKVKFHKKVTNEVFGKHAIIEDPDGHLISLAEMAPKEEFTQIPYYHGFAPE
jgi:glyoxalase/bleomycin resistance protein/dioxygenase superfamily protein